MKTCTDSQGRTRVCTVCGDPVFRSGTRGNFPKRCGPCAAEFHATYKRTFRSRVATEGAAVHGYGGYANGCRCEVCTQAKRDYMRSARAEGKIIDRRRNHDPRASGYTSRPSLEHG